MKRTPEETEQTRQALLNAAMSVFLEAGYSDSTIEAIAERAGVTRGAFYHHFDSKPAVYYALLEERNRPALGIVGDVLSDVTTPAPEILRRLLSEYLRLIGTDSSFRQVHELVMLKSAFVPELSEGRAQKIQGQRTTIAWLGGVIERGKAAGQFRLDINPADEAVILYAALSGVIMTELIDPGSVPLAERYEALARRLVSALLPRED